MSKTWGSGSIDNDLVGLFKFLVLGEFGGTKIKEMTDNENRAS